MNREHIYPTIQMTDACNKRCSACLRTPDLKQHKFTYNNFLLYLNDLKTLSETSTISYQFVTGGEPTIWKESGKNIMDILASLDKLSYIKNLTMPTNGKVFEDIGFAQEFVKNLTKRLKHILIIGISIADYQENFDDNGCKALDNLLKACEGAGNKIIPVILVTLSVQDNTSERLKKLYPKVFQRITPLAPLGNAVNMQKNCPGLSLQGNNKDSLGSFLPQFMKDIKDKLGIPESDFYATPNADIIDRLSIFNHCGQSIFADEKWRYCLLFRDNPDFDLCRIGDMKSNTLKNFIDKRPLLQSIRKHGVISTVNLFKDKLSKETRKKLDIMFDPSNVVSIAYRGCIICKELYDIGVFHEIDECR